MKEDSVSNFRALILKKGEVSSEMNINDLGYLNLIGFSPSKLKEGKKIYRNIISFIDNNDFAGMPDKSELETIVLNNLVLYVEKQKWHEEKLFDEEDFSDDILHNGDKGISLTRSKFSRPKSYNSVQYGIIEKKVNDDRNTKANIMLARMINEFNQWINEYLFTFSCAQVSKDKLTKLLKLIVSK